jgi:DNA uptake protein ComE-like DNA-binding protein
MDRFPSTVVKTAIFRPATVSLPRFFRLSPLLLTVAICGCTASNTPSDQQVRQQSAQATAQVKDGAKQAGQTIKEGAAVAEKKIDDVAAGVKDGLNTPTSGSVDTTSAVDINSATEARLTSLPGVDASTADKIIQNRPYTRSHDLVKKGVVDESEYDRIASRVVVR